MDWDGFDPDYLGRSPTPNLDTSARRGSLSIADGTFHALSNPSRASMSTGAYPEVHGRCLGAARKILEAAEENPDGPGP